MKITLISTGSDKDAGPKEIAKFLKNNNHKVSVFNYRNITKIKDSDLIVVSANPSTNKIASELIKQLKSLNKPIVYAGIYPSLSPEKCIKETDLVITGRPKETILELANKLENLQKISDIPNLWFAATKDKLIKN